MKNARSNGPSGARVVYGATSHRRTATIVQFFGKGRKGACRAAVDEEGEAMPDYAFRNARGDRLRNPGVRAACSPVDAAFPRVGHLTIPQPNCTRSPPATCRVVAVRVACRRRSEAG